jgi:hypothetical protein
MPQLSLWSSAMTVPGVFHCSCGASRPVSNGLKFVSCVRCGRAMTPHGAEIHIPRPSRRTLVLATLTSQVLGAVAFALAALWLIVLGERTPLTISILVLGALHVFTAGMAYRGSVNALGAAAFVDVALALACITKPAAVKTFVLVPTLWLTPDLVRDAAFAMTIAGLVALAAAAACIAAVPQTRRLLAWRTERVLRAARVWR